MPLAELYSGRVSRSTTSRALLSIAAVSGSLRYVAIRRQAASRYMYLNSAVLLTDLSGRPHPRVLDRARILGTTPFLWKANISPVRPTPVERMGSSTKAANEPIFCQLISTR